MNFSNRDKLLINAVALALLAVASMVQALELRWKALMLADTPVYPTIMIIIMLILGVGVVAMKGSVQAFRDAEQAA